MANKKKEITDYDNFDTTEMIHVDTAIPDEQQKHLLSWVCKNASAPVTLSEAKQLVEFNETLRLRLRVTGPDPDFMETCCLFKAKGVMTPQCREP
jgi:hypothetical protein